MSKQEMSYDMKVLIAVLLLIFAYPIGVIVMWRWTNWSKITKYLVSSPIIIGAILVTIGVILAIINAIVHGGGIS